MSTTTLSPLESLASELLLDITDYLPLPTLYSFRLVSHTCERIAARRFSQSIADRLDEVIVFNTDVGLRLLRGIVQIPSCRNLIKSIAIISARQVIWNLHGTHTHLLEFEASLVAKKLWADIFTLLKQAASLQEIWVARGTRLPAPWDLPRLEPGFGTKQLIPYAEPRDDGLDFGMSLRHLSASFASCFVAIVDTGFETDHVYLKSVNTGPYRHDGKYPVVPLPRGRAGKMSPES
ncbi:hypothetical protein M011DRAFT_529434 [Sporormia fimetaria CBS 119925]|uniref:F-box domain-containing protein n=1 Tax=Sporormia fimetaria CBS 119925 TaxID=1340428 RepID=A0A6A6V039_9PLEO|nr:hypothetical protein M011DRAFT_529434 [Sporormia fimetaria CBS 119925]